MNIKMIGAFAALALVAACAETDKSATEGSGAAAATATVTPGSQEDLVKNVGDRVFFDFDKYALSADARATLDRQANWLQQFGHNEVLVAGNTDERGTEEYNIALGWRRANSARDYLVARSVSGSRITTTSYGKSRPVALGSDEQAWAQNRNATTTVR